MAVLKEFFWGELDMFPAFALTLLGRLESQSFVADHFMMLCKSDEATVMVSSMCIAFT